MSESVVPVTSPFTPPSDNVVETCGHCAYSILRTGKRGAAAHGGGLRCTRHGLWCDDLGYRCGAYAPRAESTNEPEEE